MNDYFAVWQKYEDFSGRSRRREYWYFTLFNGLVMLAIEGAMVALSSSLYAVYICGAIFMIYFLSAFVPTLAVQVRRLHDIGKSGFWILISFVPIVGPILLIIWFCMNSESGTNQYGPNPKDSALSETAAYG